MAITLGDVRKAVEQLKDVPDDRRFNIDLSDPLGLVDADYFVEATSIDVRLGMLTIKAEIEVDVDDYEEDDEDLDDGDDEDDVHSPDLSPKEPSMEVFYRHVLHFEVITRGRDGSAMKEMSNEVAEMKVGETDGIGILFANHSVVGQEITKDQAAEILSGVANGPEYMRGYVPVG
jgi:hypothetical protein